MIVQRKMKLMISIFIGIILVLGIYKSIARSPIEDEYLDKNNKMSSNRIINILTETNHDEGDRSSEIKDLKEARLRIQQLEEKLRVIENKLETQIPKIYPKVKFLNYKSRKRILVTGGAGFVGSHLVDRLMLDGHEVIAVDNFFTGRKRNVEHWIGHENFELVHHDVVRPLYVEVDEIYHLASPASPPHYMLNPVKTIKTNTLGTINMLGLAKRVGARVLIASTSEVYGDPDEHPQSETYWGHVNPIDGDGSSCWFLFTIIPQSNVKSEPLGLDHSNTLIDLLNSMKISHRHSPRACYDEGKRVAETLSYAYERQENISVRVARIFNTYGPRMHMNDGRVVSNFILQALQNNSITIYGDGKQTRSFQYVSDLVDGLVALMASNYSQPVNIGNPVEHTIEEFAVLIQNLVGGNSKVVALPAVEDDPQRRKPDISRAKKVLRWEPKITLVDGLKKTIAYFEKELLRSKHTLTNGSLKKPVRDDHDIIEQL